MNLSLRSKLFIVLGVFIAAFVCFRFIEKKVFPPPSVKTCMAVLSDQEAGFSAPNLLIVTPSGLLDKEVLEASLKRLPGSALSLDALRSSVRMQIDEGGDTFCIESLNLNRHRASVEVTAVAESFRQHYLNLYREKQRQVIEDLKSRAEKKILELDMLQSKIRRTSGPSETENLLTSIESRMGVLRDRLMVLRDTYKDTHPEIKSVQAEIGRLELKQKKLQSLPAPNLEAIKAQYDSSQSEYDKILEKVHEAELRYAASQSPLRVVSEPQEDLPAPYQRFRYAFLVFLALLLLLTLSLLFYAKKQREA